ncbi:MAG: S8 family serine peptidase [Byssovorax sp.]
MTRPQILSVPERLDADLLLTGRGVCIAFVDSGFYPHPDLMQPARRILAYLDVARDQPLAADFLSAQVFGWHGTMASCCAAGNGYLSGGRYRGLASEADVVLIKASTERGKILGKNVARGIRVPLHHPELPIRIVNVSLGVDRDDPDYEDVEAAVAEVVAAGITVIAAAGNDAGRVPGAPGSAAGAITVGGVDDHNTPDPGDDQPWPSSYGSPRPGVHKPDLLAPAIWLPAPMLPGTLTAREAAPLFQLLSVLEESASSHTFSPDREEDEREERASVRAMLEAVYARMRRCKYISPDYQHVDGTSFAAPITTSVAAQMLEANPTLTPEQIRRGLMSTAEPLPGVDPELQGAGMLHPRAAVTWAKRQRRRASLPPQATLTGSLIAPRSPLPPPTIAQAPEEAPATAPARTPSKPPSSRGSVKPPSSRKSKRFDPFR